MDDEKKATATGEPTDTGDAGNAEAQSDAEFAKGLGGEAAGAEKAAAQDAPAKADTAAAETAAEADTQKNTPVTEKKPEAPAKPAETQQKPADDKAKQTEGKPKPDDNAAKVEELTQKAQKQTERLRGSMARAAAYEVGIRADRVKQAVALAAVNGIDPAADDAEEQFKAALQAVADDMPEFVAQSAGTGSVGAFARNKETKEDPFLKGLRG